MPKVTLLIVEDDQDRIKRLERLLTPTYLFEFAENAAKAAIAIRSDQHFDLAIVDWRLPVEEGSMPEPAGGLKVMRDIDEYRSNIPVIITFSWDTPELIQKRLDGLKNLRVVNILEKPLLLDELANSIKNALPSLEAAR